MVASRSPAGAALLLAAAALLLAGTATDGVAAATGNTSTICDTAKCGHGTCSEVPFIPFISTGYKCSCDPEWSQPKLLNLTTLDFAPCIIPDCPFDSSCYNFSFLWKVPPGIPFGDPCVFINCGEVGECKKGDNWSYTCECQPGYGNLLNLAMLPCIKNCSFGAGCSKLGINPTGAAPPPTPSTTAPPPGSSSSWRLLQQLLSLAIVLLLQLV